MSRLPDYSVPIKSDGTLDLFELATQILSSDMERVLRTCRLCGAYPIDGHRCGVQEPRA